MCENAQNGLSICAHACPSNCADLVQISSAVAQRRQNPSHLVLTKLDRSVTAGPSTIQPSAVVRDLDVYFDSEQNNMFQTSLRRAVTIYLISARHTPSCRGMEVPIRLILALATSRIDYCNSLSVGAPLTTIAPLQRVQSAAA